MFKPLLVGSWLVLVASAPLQAAETAKAAEQAPAARVLPADKSKVIELEWTDLLPDADLQKMEGLPEVSHEGGEGAGSAINKNLNTSNDPSMKAWADVMSSANVRGELNGRLVKIPGFVVPIEYDADQNITAFFLVPYFGACIHVPPPPPNQIVYVSGAKNLKADLIYNPFWIEGTLTTDTMSHDLANSAYSLKVNKISEYVYE
ncbi:DUF3299 domain-containing protein [Rheinheimera sp. F8]|uniref:DUF3299 domain-containing protein n=1 Tax=Rheinheimera sp. F8 TaxID=1763998 RepID=UPI000744A9E1|nr:DUF3299 domain-containing protein [Rheinheimera sp. F8]ALZ76102.1 hypothetical protein ATY27_10210 [Rheinheimera sp. F8]ALZ77717.1 hypothetical protein ATY27_19445 [Rheinheimera sp. F8]